MGQPEAPCLLLQVHGTCLGLEVLSVIISRNTSILSDMDAEDAPATLLYTDEAVNSRFLQALPPHLVTHLQNQPLAFENHMHGETFSGSSSMPAAGALVDCGHIGAQHISAGVSPDSTAVFTQYNASNSCY